MKERGAELGGSFRDEGPPKGGLRMAIDRFITFHYSGYRARSNEPAAAIADLVDFAG